ncbi:calcineurin-like phosphoesterase C-terminal domain-containing protein [Mucilaginibacter myungsuensis]|uniref:Calcineurin-like phosphoesterase C-terminal domain-containing protein n=1 Tax=Mucilaginibacter myungsuensis TaxID=649104 RepID=A0A929KX33_9SPHI|nr:calcineurin-like phosphoesterase family protein [Mucilaginibacter myungsuensis]MBE9661538.1 calcineurin-like phosphoesterase C-terminal domain-containing protein [Mucilaginibacter myungsuensis]MDN3597681.1 calcineurin-like phosphoesterase family protein [Mucilaginibacter myungsuensis]
MERRSFIKKVMIATGGIALSFKSNVLYALSSVGTVSGKVTATGKGLAGVYVTDGYSVVKTDNKGAYNIKTDDRAEFVYISVPAGYDFPHEDKVAKFYHPLKEASKFDFELKALGKNDDKHNFILWADPQVKNAKDVEQMMTTSVPDVQDVLKTMKGEHVHGICVGDLVWDGLEMFKDYKKAVTTMDIPFFQALGNHDEDYRQGGDETSDKTFKANFGPTYYSFNRGKAHYIVLDDVRYLGKEREYDGYIVDQQMEWLKKDLATVAKDTLILLCLHIPVHNAVKNNTDLYKLLEPFKQVHILSGHTHYHRNVQIAPNIYEHNHGTVCGAWWTGPVCEDGTPRGYGVYNVDGTDLKWHYKSTGQDRNYQMALYADDLTNQKRVIANVWDWDEQWKVEYWVDGAAKGVMENQKGMDPLAVKLYMGDKMPEKGRYFVEPRKTDHLFIAHLDANAKKIEVVATDRFGRKYESELAV